MMTSTQHSMCKSTVQTRAADERSPARMQAESNQKWLQDLQAAIKKGDCDTDVHGILYNSGKPITDVVPQGVSAVLAAASNLTAEVPCSNKHLTVSYTEHSSSCCQCPDCGVRAIHEHRMPILSSYGHACVHARIVQRYKHVSW